MYYQQYLTRCTVCGGHTSKKYAREHEGRCKMCTTGESGVRYYSCPTCGTPDAITAQERAKRYHCVACTRDADPEGYRREVMGYND